MPPKPFPNPEATKTNTENPSSSPAVRTSEAKTTTAMDIKKRSSSSPSPSPNAPSSTALLLLLLFIAADGAAAQVFCGSQFNLANEACSLRTFAGPNPGKPLQALHSNGSSATYGVQAEHHEHHDHEHHEHHEHEREHTAHSRRHGLGHGGRDPYDTACCRRLMGIDNACICQAMSFLPVFMSKVKHAIKLSPVPGCDVSFECGAINLWDGHLH